MRRVVTIIGLLLSLGLLTRPMTASAASPQPQWRVLHADEHTLTWELRLPPGRDAASTLLILPPDGQPHLRLLDVESTPWEGPLPAHARLPAQPWVRVRDVGYLRGFRLARVDVRALFRGRDGTPRRLRRVRVHLRYPPAPAPVSPARPSDTLELLRPFVLNPRIPATWIRPRSRLLQNVDNPPAHDPQAIKVLTADPGIYTITREDVRRVGWDPEHLDPRHIHLWVDGEEIPLWFPGEEDGRWDATDEIRFYAPPYRSIYTDTRTWWLTVDDRDGARWQEESTLPPGDSPLRAGKHTHITEEDRIYDSRLLDAHGEHWFWDDLKFADFPPYPALEYPFQIPHPAEHPQVVVALDLVAYKGASHDLIFHLNGAPAGELHSSWTGLRTVTFSLPEGLVREGRNVLTIQSADRGATPDGVYVDAITVHYRRRLDAPEGFLTFTGEAGDHTYRVEHLPPGDAFVLDITHPYHPRLIRGTAAFERYEGGNHTLTFRTAPTAPPTYLVQSQTTFRHPTLVRNLPSDLHHASRGADVIVIAPRRWHKQLTPWVTWQREQGHAVRVVALEDVYDEFAYGRPEPEAIRRFLRHAYAAWPEPLPRYALLVGDGSYDFKDHLGFHPANILPPYLAPVDPWLGETAADSLYGEVDGDNRLPDITVGRWPVRDEEQLRNLIAKTLYYERDMPLALWQRRLAFITDNYYSPRGEADSAGNFPAEAEFTLEEQRTLAFRPRRIYYTPWPPAQERFHGFTDVESMRQNIILTWNEGAGIITWIGHASYEQWGAENFFHARHLEALQNAQRFPFLLSLTCFTGYYHHPEYPSLDEVLLTKGDGGSIASWSPTGLAVGYGHHYLQEGFYATLFQGERQISRLILSAQLNLLAKAEVYAFQPQAYVILGDPLLTLKLGPTFYTRAFPIMGLSAR